MSESELEFVEPPPLAEDCESIYSIPDITFDTPYPIDLYNDSRKAKPPPASFYERLRELRDADRVFVKPANRALIRYIDEKCQFEVLNRSGQPIFFALDTTDAWASTVFEGTKPFNAMIMDYDYAEVLKLTGSGLSRLHGSSFVKSGGKIVGRIVQDDHLCHFTPTYSIEGTNGIVGLKVKGPPNAYATGLPKDPSFDVVLNSDEISLVGRISKQWLLFNKLNTNLTEASALSPEESYIVNFHPNMDLRTKCLILSLVFMMDYQFYHKTVQGGVSRKCWVIFTILFFSMVVFILVSVDFIKEHQIAAMKESLRNTTTTTEMTIPKDRDFDFDIR